MLNVEFLNKILELSIITTLSKNVLSFLCQIISNFLSRSLCNEIGNPFIINFGSFLMNKKVLFVLVCFLYKPSIFQMQITKEFSSCLNQRSHMAYDNIVNYN